MGANLPRAVRAKEGGNDVVISAISEVRGRAHAARAQSLGAVPTARVSSAADLGCGPGNSTELLVEHYPDASIVGVDNSPEMVEAAQKRLPHVKFRLGSIEEWNEPEPWDILSANAAIQWIGNHERLLGRRLERLAPGGSLAIQMPDNLNEGSHAAMREVACSAPFASKLNKAAKARPKLHGEARYDGHLKPLRPASTSGDDL